MDTAAESEAELRDVESRLKVEPVAVVPEADVPAVEKPTEAADVPLTVVTGVKRKGVKRPASVEAQGGGDEKRKGGSATLTAFTVQCGRCLKWRKVLEQEEYERIRANLTADPFYCEHAQKWHEGDAKITCETPADLLQDGSLIWAMDRQEKEDVTTAQGATELAGETEVKLHFSSRSVSSPSTDIPQPPPMWSRRIVVRGSGTSSKFSDVYYSSPCKKSLRSLSDVERLLAEKPEYVQAGISTKNFSFCSPRPLSPEAPSPPTKGPKTRKPPASSPLGESARNTKALPTSDPLLPANAPDTSAKAAVDNPDQQPA